MQLRNLLRRPAVEYDSASDHQCFRAAFTATSQAERDPTPSRAGTCTCACAAVAVPDRRSQRGRGNARRAATGKPDGHFRRTAQLSPGDRTRRNPRGRARPWRRAAFRLGQGQSILPSRLQPRPRHRLGHLLGRCADQLANQRARPGLRRSELSHSGNDQWFGGAQGSLLRRCRRLRHGRRPSPVAAGQRRSQHSIRDRGQLRLQSASQPRLGQGSAAARCSMPANSTPTTARGSPPKTHASSAE